MSSFVSGGALPRKTMLGGLCLVALCPSMLAKRRYCWRAACLPSGQFCTRMMAAFGRDDGQRGVKKRSCFFAAKGPCSEPRNIRVLPVRPRELISPFLLPDCINWFRVGKHACERDRILFPHEFSLGINKIVFLFMSCL
jgi:hypothetical protein